jgi:Membrane dipeptidase (Peptidase family M19)
VLGFEDRRHRPIARLAHKKLGKSCSLAQLLPPSRKTAAEEADPVSSHEIAGDALHVGLGTDFDGGQGTEAAPVELDTIADLPKLASALAAHGFPDPDIAAVRQTASTASTTAASVTPSLPSPARQLELSAQFKGRTPTTPPRATMPSITRSESSRDVATVRCECAWLATTGPS